MLHSSVRRVVTAAPQSPMVPSFAATSVAAVPRSSFVLNYRGHQRRYSSSSKPSRTDNGSSEIGVPKSGVAKAAGEGKRKRSSRIKDAAATAAAAAPPAKTLPSVPPTHHISQEVLGLSTFFSLHRPISVTQSFPKAVTEERFAEIFEQSKRAKIGDVISTLGSAVNQLERPMSRLNLDSNNESSAQVVQIHAEEYHDADGSTRIELRRADGSESSVYVQLNQMSGEFLPFRPPPLPEPQTAAEAEAESADAEAAEAESEATVPQTRTYKAILTIEETLDTDGQYKVTAHSPTLVEEGTQPHSFLERMALRQMQWEEARQRRRERSGGETILALSVRRQKKLKIKKKKYKKLMRRTRNERRQLGK